MLLGLENYLLASYSYKEVAHVAAKLFKQLDELLRVNCKIK